MCTINAANPSALSAARKDIESEGNTFLASKKSAFSYDDPVVLQPPSFFVKEKKEKGIGNDSTQRIAQHFTQCCTKY